MGVDELQGKIDKCKQDIIKIETDLTYWEKTVSRFAESSRCSARYVVILECLRPRELFGSSVVASASAPSFSERVARVLCSLGLHSLWMRYRVLSDWARFVDRESLKPLKSTGEINASSLGSRFGGSDFGHRCRRRARQS